MDRFVEELTELTVGNTNMLTEMSSQLVKLTDLLVRLTHVVGELQTDVANLVENQRSEC